MGNRTIVRLFGGIDVSVDGVPIVFPSRQAAVLFAFLILNGGKSASRARLADLFWEDADEKSARQNLSTALWRVKVALKGISDIQIHSTGDTIGLVFEGSTVEVDVETFDRLVAARDWKEAEHLPALQCAVALYRGELLDGFDAEWCEESRRHYSALYRDALESISELLFERREYGACAEYAERHAKIDPLSEEVTERLMLVYHLMGKRLSALALYERFKDRLHSELGLHPSSKMIDLVDRLRKQSDWVAQPGASHRSLLQPRPDAADVRLVGREKEMGLLLQLLNEPLETARLYAIRGDAGVGKTRLAHAFEEEASLRGWEVLKGRCPDLQSPPPYQVFVQALWPRIERYVNIHGPLSSVIERLASKASSHSLEVPSQNESQISDSAIVLEVLLSLLEEQPTRRGTLLVLEDVHRLDHASEALLMSVADRSPKSNLVIVITLRDETPYASDLLRRLGPSVPIMDLGPLGPAETVRLAADVLGTGSIPLELQDTLWSVTAGVPLFTIEFVKYLADRGYFMRDSRGVMAFHSERFCAERPKFPTRIVEILRKRIEGLDESTRELISNAAVLGAEVSFPELASMFDRSLEQLSKGVEQLLELRLLTEDGDRLKFQHDMVRLAVLQTLDSRELKDLHRRAGDLLEQSGSTRYELLAWHYERSGDLSKASYYSELSGDGARDLHAIDDALRWYTLALAHLAAANERNKEAKRRRTSLLLKRQAVLELVGNRRLQAQDVKEISELATRLRDPVLKAQAEYWNSRLLSRANSNREALRAAEKAAYLYRQTSDPLGEANAFESMGLAYINLRDQRGARSSFARSLALYRRASSPSGESRSLVNLGTLMALDGRNVAALRHLDRAEHVLRVLDDKRSLAGATLQRAVLKRCLGHLKESEALFVAGIRMMREVGDRIGEARGLSQLANTHTAMGKLKLAVHEAHCALKKARAAGDTRALIVFLNNAAYGPFRSVGDFRQAERFVGLAIKLAGESGREENLANYYDTMAAVLLSKGEAQEALEWAVQSARCYRKWKGRFRFLEAHINFRHGMCYLELEDYEQAIVTLQRALATWERDEELELRILALSGIGRAYAAQGQLPVAVTCARNVERLLRQVDGIDFLHVVHWHQYVTLRLTGSNASARRSLRRAYVCLLQQAHGLKGRYRRCFLDGVKANREIIGEFERVHGGPASSDASFSEATAIAVHPLTILGRLDDVSERRRVVSEYMRAGRMTQREMALRLGVSERTVRTDMAFLRNSTNGTTAPHGGAGMDHVDA